MTTIASFTRPEEAQLLRMRLEAAGIAAFLHSDTVIGMELIYSNAFGGVRVHVADEDLSAAREYIGSDAGLPPDPEAIRCPQCGSTAIGSERFSTRLAIPDIPVIQFPAPLHPSPAAVYRLFTHVETGVTGSSSRRGMVT